MINAEDVKNILRYHHLFLLSSHLVSPIFMSFVNHFVTQSMSISESSCKFPSARGGSLIHQAKMFARTSGQFIQLRMYRHHFAARWRCFTTNRDSPVDPTGSLTCVDQNLHTSNKLRRSRFVNWRSKTEVTYYLTLIFKIILHYLYIHFILLFFSLWEK